MITYCRFAMWIYIAIAIFLVFVIYKERQALGCPTIPNGEDCDNANGKAVKGSAPEPGDDKETLYKKIIFGSRFMDRFVVWRVAIIVGFISTIFIYFFLYQRFPSELELTISLFVIAAVFYFILSFNKFHIVAHVEKNIEECVDQLRQM